MPRLLVGLRSCAATNGIEALIILYAMGARRDDRACPVVALAKVEGHPHQPLVLVGKGRLFVPKGENINNHLKLCPDAPAAGGTKFFCVGPVFLRQ